ncbi:BrnT family toxin [uncultured Sphingomonas sp.]|uniref:BrnT family toxin n=1 Tax=uncultured Sphingomonas sp. TaxID=158754 RepID=UPI0035CBD656
MIEFDADKDVDNQAKHGLTLVAAEPLFDGPFVEEVDARYNYGETRLVATGPVATFGGRVFVVVYTWRDAVRRVISFRKANDREVRKYHTSDE